MGLRSPIHTLARLINPFKAKATLQAIFHPAYRTSHQHSALRLGYQNSAVIKGEGMNSSETQTQNTHLWY